MSTFKAHSVYIRIQLGTMTGHWDWLFSQLECWNAGLLRITQKTVSSLNEPLHSGYRWYGSIGDLSKQGPMKNSFTVSVSDMGPIFIPYWDWSNCRPLESESPAQPTEPLPLPKYSNIWSHSHHKKCHNGEVTKRSQSNVTKSVLLPTSLPYLWDVE